MDMLLTNEAHYKAIARFMSRRPNYITIVTYGLYAGITQNGDNVADRYQNDVHDLLEAIDKNMDKVRDASVNIIVGLPEYYPCRLQCPDCLEKYKGQLIRMVKTAKHWPRFNWVFKKACHMKAFVFKKGSIYVGGVTGGRNLSSSSWEDLSFTLSTEEANELDITLRELLADSKPITEENMCKITEGMEEIIKL